MTKVRDFVAALARAGKSYTEIKNTADAAFGGKTLSKSVIYKILNKVKAGETTEDKRHLNPKKMKRPVDIIAAVAADVKADCRITCRDLATAHGVSFGTVHNILHEEQGLVKKSAQWVPKLLSPEQKEERVQICSEFVAAVNRSSMTMLDQIIMMDETMVSYHTPQMKRQSKQWIEKGKQAPSRLKSMPAGQNRCCWPSLTARAWSTPTLFRRGPPSMPTTSWWSWASSWFT
jgi:transposase